MDSEIFEYKNSIELAVIRFSKLLNEAYRKFHREENLEISHEEFNILDVINTTPGIIPIQIARALCIQRSYVGKLLNKLNNMGYIKQEQALKGKKQTVIRNYITNEGLIVYNKALNLMKKKYNQVMTKMQKEKINYLVQQINELNKKIELDMNIKF